MDQLTWPGEALELLKKYRYVLLVVLAGILLMALPKEDRSSTPQPTAETEAGTTLTLEESLAQILSGMEGAGQVQVLLTQARGEEVLYQTDNRESRTEQNRDIQQDTVLIRDDDRKETGLVRQRNPPAYLGAIILCQGADKAGVRLAIVEAVMGVTGLSSDKITVLKMK